MRAAARKAAWRYLRLSLYRKSRCSAGQCFDRFKELAGRAPQSLSATISTFVTGRKQAKRFLVSGFVQGVGFRYFARDEAESLNVSGYVRNLRDGRVEAYVIGTDKQLAEFRAALERGPRFASVSQVQEEPAAIDPQYANGFVITYDS
jgi:acylphosphatase